MVEYDLTAGVRILYQRTFKMKTFCMRCGKEITYKLLPFDSKKNPFGSNYTLKCRCGLEKYSYQKPDKFHKDAIFLKHFISRKEYIRNYNELNELEKAGMKEKGLKNGRKIYFK